MDGVGGNSESGGGYEQTVRGGGGCSSSLAAVRAHSRLVSWFGDIPCEETCPFSIHSFITSWGKDHGLVAGKWLGPCVLARGIAALVSKHRPGGLTAYVVAGEDGGFGGGAPTLHRSSVMNLAREEARSLEKVTTGKKASRYRDGDGDRDGDEDDGGGDLLDLPGAPFSKLRVMGLRGSMYTGSASRSISAQDQDVEGEKGVPLDGVAGDGDGDEDRAAPGDIAGRGEWTPMIILVPLVLGLDKNINPRYLPSLLAMLSLPQTLGIVGGLSLIHI